MGEHRRLKTRTSYKEIYMRIMVLLCTVFLTGCTYTRVAHVNSSGESRIDRAVSKAFNDQPWVSVSASIISYPADQRFISTRELEGDMRALAFQQYPHLQFAREGYSFLSPEQASEILALAAKLDAVHFVEMPLLDVLVSNSGCAYVGIPNGFSVWLRTLAVSDSNATIKYRVGTWEVAGAPRSDLDLDWEMSGEAELNLGVCYLRTIATDDPQRKVAVLLRLVSVSHPEPKENDEA